MNLNEEEKTREAAACIAAMESLDTTDLVILYRTRETTLGIVNVGNPVFAKWVAEAVDRQQRHDDAIRN